MSAIGTKIADILATLAMFLPATKAPETRPHPSGDGEYFVIKKGDDYETREFQGPQVPRRRHLFADLPSLADWLLRHAKDPARTEILMDHGSGLVVAAISTDSKKGLVCKGDLVTCQQLGHPRLQRWVEMFDTALTQRGLHNFLVGAAEDTQKVEGPRGADLGHYGQRLADQLRKLEIGSEGSLIVKMDEHGNTRFTGTTDDLELKGKIEPRFKIAVPFFLGVKDAAGAEVLYEFEVLLRMELPRRPSAPGLGHNDITFTMTCPGFRVIQHQAVQDSMEYLRRLLGEDSGFLVGLGGLTLINAPDWSR